MSKTWFTADTHFYHKNVIKFCSESRPGFETVEEMNQRLIDNWNSQVSPLDHVYILGDFSFGKAEKTELILQQLNGILHLIKGNHDHWINSVTKTYFASIDEYKVFKRDNIKVCMFHYPIHEWDGMHYGSFHLFGHTHGSVQLHGKSLDVGIDNRPDNDMKLWEWQDIKDYMNNKPIISHHKGKE